MHRVAIVAKPVLLCCSMILAGTFAAIGSAGEATLLFHCPFDGSSKAAIARGEAGPRQESGLNYRPGLFGQAVLVGPKGRLQYAAPGNLNKERGTISLWFKPNWDGNATDPETRHVLFQEGPPPRQAARLQSIVALVARFTDAIRCCRLEGPLCHVRYQRLAGGRVAPYRGDVGLPARNRLIY